MTRIEMTTIISFYDYTGEMVKPAAKAGATCFCYDIQHEYWQKEHPNATTHYPSGGSITYLHADLHNPAVMLLEIPAEHKGALEAIPQAGRQVSQNQEHTQRHPSWLCECRVTIQLPVVNNRRITKCHTFTE